MTHSRFASTILSIVAIGGMVVAPALSLAADQHKDHGKDKHDNRGHGNDNRGRGNDDRDRGNGHRDRGNDHGKNPKDHGFHDNRNQWWKDDHRRRDDNWREEARRREEERLRAERWRRDEDWRRQEAWRRDHNNWSRDSVLQRESNHRQQTKNEWRNIAYVAGGVALLGLLKHDKTLIFAGSAGALYSLYRYEQDRKSQSRIDRLRADYFSRPYFVRDGHRYDRRIMIHNGQRYYQFHRH